MITREISACPYIKDPSRWHVDMFFLDPHSKQEVRKRRVAPPGLTREAAIAWGQNERLKLVTSLVASEDEAEEEGAQKKKTKKPIAPTIAELWCFSPAGSGQAPAW